MDPSPLPFLVVPTPGPFELPWIAIDGIDVLRPPVDASLEHRLQRDVLGPTGVPR